MKYSIWKKQNKKSFTRTRLCTIFSALMICTMGARPTKVQAETQNNEKQPTIAVSKPANFINGDFEQPECNSTIAAQQKFVQWSPDKWYYFDEENVPGWDTIAVNAADRSKASANSIQLNRYKYDDTAANSGKNSGNQYAELNSDFASRLYQYLPTVPGTKLYWSFAHAAHHSWTNGPDTMAFVLRPTDHVETPAQLGEIQTLATTYPDGTGTATNTQSAVTVTPQSNNRWAVYSGAYTVPAGQTNTSFEFVAVSSSSGNINEGNFLDSITFQTGASLITEKAITNSSGQRIDGGYGEYGDIVTVTMKVANWGETDAAPCVLTDTLGDGLQFVPDSGTVTGDSGVIGNVSCSGSTVTANIGGGATTAAGGTIKGSQSMGTSGTSGKGQSAVVTYKAKITGTPGSTVKNQAKVSYNDKGYESYNPSGLISYSTVDYGISDANYLGVAGHGTYSMKMLNADGTTRVAYDHTDRTNSETYVNQFTVADRQVDGKVWYDKNQNGKLDAGETLLTTTIKMQKLGSDGITWTDANDWSGAALTTKNTTGSYVFKGILPGQYRVLAAISSSQARPVKLKSSTSMTEVISPTGTQGDYDNDADAATVKDSGLIWQVVQTLDKTSNAYAPTAGVYYTHNVDFGRVPIATITKGSQIISTGNTNLGTAGAPVTVTYGDTVKYTLTVTNNSSVMTSIDSNMIKVEDALPDGLTYVSSTGVVPAVSGQRLTWSGLPSISNGTPYVITVTARVTKPNKDIFNTAYTYEPDAPDVPCSTSNTTYHHSIGLTLTIGKLVKGDMSDPQKAFTFNVTLGNSQSALLSGLGTTGSTTYRDELNNADLSGGGTITFGNAGSTVSLKHGQSVTFHDLPMGIKYTINETDNSGYTPTVSIINDTANAGTANTGNYSNLTQITEGLLNSNNAVANYSNTKTSVPPTGIILEFWPYILIVLLAAGIGMIMLHHGRRKKYDSRHEGL